MKKIINLFALAGMLLISSVYADTVDKVYDVKPFNEVKVSGNFELNLTQGESQRVVINAEKDDFEHLKVFVNHRTLVIEHDRELFDVSSWHVGPLKINVTAKDLKKIRLSGSVKATVKDIKSKKMDIRLSGSVKGAFAGDYRNLSVDAAGNSDFVLTGKAEEMKLQASGNNKIDAKNMQAEDVEIRASGATNMSVNAENKLKIRASGANHIIYYGDPEISQDVSGFSKIEKDPVTK